MTVKKELNGRWQFSESGKKRWKAANVPGCYQMDLMALGKLPDPFYRINEKQFVDMDYTEWDYKKDFTLKKEGLVFLPDKPGIRRAGYLCRYLP